jgi:hypothetical protein
MRTYGSEGPQGGPYGKLIEPSRYALGRLPPAPVVQAMLEEIKNGNDKSRAFMNWVVLRRSAAQAGYDMSDMKELDDEMKRRVGEIASAVLAVSRDDRVETRNWALSFLIELCNAIATDPAELEGFIPRLQEELPSRDVWKILMVSGLLVESVPDTEGLVDSLTYVLSDKQSWSRLLAIRQLGQLGPRAAPAVPKLASLLNEYLKLTSSRTEVRTGRGPPTDLRFEIIQALGAIGPAAKEALPALRDAGSHHFKRIRSAAEKAITQIEGSHQEDQ